MGGRGSFLRCLKDFSGEGRGSFRKVSGRVYLDPPVGVRFEKVHIHPLK